MKKVLILEPRRHHLEILYPQAVFLLETGHNVYIATKEESYNGELLSSLKNKASFVLRTKDMPMFLFFKRIKDKIKEHNIDLVIINTMENFSDILLYNIFLNKFDSLRIIHNFDYVLEENRYDNNIKNYLFNKMLNNLNDSVKHNIVLADRIKKTADNYKFPKTSSVVLNGFSDFINKENETYFEKDKVRFAVQGKFSFKRRNYKSIIESLKKLNEDIRKKSEFLIIGNINTDDGEHFLEMIKENNLENNFIYFNEYINYNKFFNLISESDYILPLIDNSLSDHKKYNKYKITSSEIMAHSFNKPIISSKDFKIGYPLNEITIDYEGTKLYEGIRKALSMNSKEYNEILDKFENVDQLNRNIQKSRYLEIIENI